MFGLKPLVEVSGGSGINGEALQGGDFFLSPGGVIGFRAVFDSFVLFPEINVHIPYDVEVDELSRVRWQAGLAVQFAVISGQ